MRVVDPPLQLVHDDLILLKLAVRVALVPDPVMLVGGSEVGTQLVDLLQRQFLCYLHLALLLAPLLVVQFDDAQVFKLQLLFLAPARLLLAVLLVVRVEVLLFILREGIPLRHAVDVEIPYLFYGSAEPCDLLADRFAQLWHFELFLKL